MPHSIGLALWFYWTQQLLWSSIWMRIWWQNNWLLLGIRISTESNSKRILLVTSKRTLFNKLYQSIWDEQSRILIGSIDVKKGYLESLLKLHYRKKGYLKSLLKLYDSTVFKEKSSIPTSWSSCVLKYSSLT